MPLDKYQKLAEDRRPRYEKRWQRFGKVYTSVHSFDRWDRGSRFEDLLWWDLMTRGRYDGSYLPEVAEFHRRRPDYQFDPSNLNRRAADWSDEAEAATHAIEADASADDAGDTIATDVS